MCMFMTLAPILQQGDGLAGIGIVVGLVAILERKSVNIDDRGVLPGLGNHVGVVQDLVFLNRHEQNVHLRVDGLQQLMIEVHVGDVERNVPWLASTGSA